jgi:hypothetical protein
VNIILVDTVGDGVLDTVVAVDSEVTSTDNLEVDTSGDGKTNVIVVDTTGDGVPDTIVHAPTTSAADKDSSAEITSPNNWSN